MRTLIILVGLLHLCGSNFGLECNSAVLKDFDFPGYDFASVFASDAEHCQLLCTQNPSCLFFAFVCPNSPLDSRFFYCFLKTSASGKPGTLVAKKGTDAGYSLKNCNPDPQPCLSHVYQDVDFPGSDYRHLFTPDYEECQRACTNDPGCQFFTFADGQFKDQSVQYRCFLKFSWSIPRTPNVVANAARTSGFSQKLLKTQTFQTECESTFLGNTDYPGNDIDYQPAASPEQCQALCSAHPLCTHFSYVSNIFRCYLKNSGQLNPTAANGITSGLPARFCQLDNGWIKTVYQGIDFPYSDMRYFSLSSADLCQKSCTEDPNCQFYSYNIPSQICYLKRVVTLPAPSGIAQLAHVVSGFTQRNCLSEN